tara:strand:- start:278 stop:970 length:693 start_codon:yes stop_codon:yes gene_type:complete
MSKLKLEGNASGTGVITLTAPNTNVDRTITLPDSAGSLLDTTSTLDATKLAGALPAIDGSALTNLPISPAGKVLQVVSVTKTDEWSTTSTSYVDVTGMSVSITPSSTTSKIYVMVQVAAGGTEVSSWLGVMLRLYRDTTSISQSTVSTGATAGVNFGTGSGLHQNNKYATWFAGGNYLDSPNTTSAITYKIKLATVNYGSATAFVNRSQTATDQFSGTGTSSITLMEIGA